MEISPSRSAETAKTQFRSYSTTTRNPPDPDLIDQVARIAEHEPLLLVVDDAHWADVASHRFLRFLAVPLLVLAVLLLGAVLIPGVGVTAGGATRWLRFGAFGLQPGELAKLALIVYLATWLGAKREHVGSWRITVPFVLVTMLVAGLVIAEPDLGTTIVIVMVALAMYFAAGARVMMFAALGILASVGVAALAVINPERLERLTTFLNPWAQPRDAGFQTIQMLYALGLGGPFGEGLGAGKEKTGYLPHPYTDSIFAVLGDELGLAGTLLIVLLFLALAFRGVRIALRAADSTGALLATGITMWLCFQAWVNMAVVASLVPMTGITLPFISYGGSSLCVGLIAVGILLNVGRARATQRTSVPRASRRWRDGRTREPAPRGRGSAPRNGSRHHVPLHRWSSRPRG